MLAVVVPDDPVVPVPVVVGDVEPVPVEPVPVPPVDPVPVVEPVPVVVPVPVVGVVVGDVGVVVVGGCARRSCLTACPRLRPSTVMAVCRSANGTFWFFDALSAAMNCP